MQARTARSRPRPDIKNPVSESIAPHVKYEPRGTENYPFQSFLDQQLGIIIPGRDNIQVTVNSI